MFDLTPFTYPVSERDKFLTLTRDRPRKSDALSPCDLDADDVDYEMQQGLNLEMITLCGLNQEGFAHFCKVYGRSYRAICLDKCQLIGDLSPLGELENLEYLCIRWNVRAEKLWDMRNNRSLRAVELHDCRKLTQNLALLSTAPGLTDVIVCGSVFS